jgi:hypothetical protein
MPGKLDAQLPEAPVAPSERKYSSSMALFFKLCIVPILIESGMLVAVVHAYHLPRVGDPMYRYSLLAIPGFWAILLPLWLVPTALLNMGQQVHLAKNGFVWTRGSKEFSVLWKDAAVSAPVEKRFDAQFRIMSRSTQASITVRSLFFPQYEEMKRDLDRFMRTSRNTDDIVISTGPKPPKKK